MYKLVAFDLDGTLLNDDKLIVKETIQIMDRLKREGVDFLIATGRGYISAKNLIPDMHRDLIAICNNGSVVRNLKDDSLIYQHTLDGNIVMDILLEGDKFNLNPLIHINEFESGYDVLIRKDNSRFAKDKRNSKSVLRYKEVEKYNLEDLDRVLALAFFDREDLILDFFESVNKKYRKKYNSHIMENVNSGEALAEFMSLKSNKWLAIKEYANGKGIKDEEIVVFGDDNNDREMIKNAGLGIAMKNANESVKKIADRITEENNNGLAIYKELKKIF